MFRNNIYIRTRHIILRALYCIRMTRKEMKMKKKIEKIINKETILYIFFGVWTTIVNFGSFVIFEKFFGSEYYLIANVGSFICATLFAFITNKYFVFESHSWKIKVWVKELISFVMSRIVTFLIIEEFGLFFLVSICRMGNLKFGMIDGKLAAKVILAFAAVLANYILGKFLVFKNDKK